MNDKTIWDFTVKRGDGAEQSLADFRGQVVLIVNTATACGFTPQYEGLEELYRKYRDQGFSVLDFPSNQFGKQAPGSDAEIDSFCRLNFDTTFPRMAKLEVNGPGADPLFDYLKQAAPGVLGKAIKWNFTKFLIDRRGRVRERFAPSTKPEQLTSAIEQLLGETEA